MSNNAISLDFLTEENLEDIHLTTLDILENKGVLFTCREALDIFEANGLSVTDGIVKFQPEIVEKAIASAPEKFVRRGRKPEYDVEVGTKNTRFGGGSLSLYVVDGENYQRREALMEDTVNFTRLIDGLDNLSFGNGVVKPADVPDSVIHAVWLQNILRNTYKPSCCWYATSKEMAADTISIMAAACGGLDELAEAKTWAITSCPVGGLKWGKSVIGLIEMAKVGVPIEIMDTPFPGSMSPVTLAGALTLSNATVLSGLVLSQLINPGTPVIYAFYGGIMDMQVGSHAFGTPEVALYNAAAGALCRKYKIPSNLTAPTSDSKVPDSQAAYEKMMIGLLSALGGVDCLTLLGGQLDFALSASYEQMVIDNEIAGQILRILKGFEVNKETLAAEIIKNTDHGGHYLENEHTFKHFKDVAWFPLLSDRQSREEWEAQGGKDAVNRAKDIARKLIEENRPKPLSDERMAEVDKIVNDILKRENVELGF